jgi:hypothetical protein
MELIFLHKVEIETDVYAISCARLVLTAGIEVSEKDYTELSCSSDIACIVERRCNNMLYHGRLFNNSKLTVLRIVGLARIAYTLSRYIA